MSQGRFVSCQDFGWTRRKGEEQGLEECCEQKCTTGVFMAYEITDVYEFCGNTEWALLDEVGWFAGCWLDDARQVSKANIYGKAAGCQADISHVHSEFLMAFPNDSVDKESSCSAGDSGDLGLIPGWEDPLEEEMATHSSILAWRIPWTEEPGGLQSMGLQRVEHD